ncbi:Glutathione S-transferase T3 [Glycine soja]
MQKFKGHYRQAISLKKSGCMDNDVTFHAYAIWKEDKGSDFGLEHVCQLLKDQLKWSYLFTENCSKRMKIFASRAYSSSTNPETPIEDSEADTSSPIVLPMGQKATKRKSIGKEYEHLPIH